MNLSSDLKLSPIPKDLLEDIQRLFPNRCPKEQDSERRIWMEVGKQELIEFLKVQYQRQQKAAKDMSRVGDTLPLSSILHKPQQQEDNP